MSISIFIHSFILLACAQCGDPCRYQKLLPFPSVMYPFFPPFSTNQSSILPHFILTSISWSTSQPRCFQIHVQYFLGEFYFLQFSARVQTNVIYLTLLSLLQWGFNNYINASFVGSYTKHICGLLIWGWEGVPTLPPPNPI